MSAGMESGRRDGRHLLEYFAGWLYQVLCTKYATNTYSGYVILHMNLSNSILR